MIQAYRLDPDGIIPAGLKEPKVWFRMPGYMGFLTHPCVTSDAIPFRPSLLDAPPSRQAFASAAIGDPPDRDGAYRRARPRRLRRLGGGCVSASPPLGDRPRMLSMPCVSALPPSASIRSHLLLTARIELANYPAKDWVVHRASWVMLAHVPAVPQIALPHVGNCVDR